VLPGQFGCNNDTLVWFPLCVAINARNNKSVPLTLDVHGHLQSYCVFTRHKPAVMLGAYPKKDS
jgi:hypothetical protein